MVKAGRIEISEDGLFADMALPLDVFIQYKATSKGDRVTLTPTWLRFENGKFHREFGTSKWFTMREIKGLWYALGAIIGQKIERDDMGEPAGKFDG